LVFVLFAAAAASLVGLTCWLLAGRHTGADADEYLTATVWKGPYDFAVLEQGTVESSANVEIRCQVRSRGSNIMVIDVVPEGSVVQEGDVLVELDASNFQLEENAQKILISTRELQLATADNNLRAAQIAKREYLEGLYITEEKTVLSELFLAERAKSTAAASLESAKVLHSKGIVTALQMESAQFMLDDATNNLDAAHTRLETLRNLTKQKETTLLDATIASAEADLKAQQQSLRLEETRLKEIQDQIAKCVITAPAPGQVIYATENSNSSQSQFVLTPGALVRERQVLIWLPNADDMQVRATVNEAHVTQVRAGLPVSIRIDALKDQVLEGIVTKVNPFAEPTFFFNAAIKKYATTIKITNPPPELRVGMNAEARIHVEQRPDALQVPVQALAEANGHYYSLVKEGEDYETREVDIGSTNDKVATIDAGLKEGDEVVLDPRSTGDLLVLPATPPVVLQTSDKPATREETRPVSQPVSQPLAEHNLSAGG
jgi:RND family efflux transporter MFP subunit